MVRAGLSYLAAADAARLSAATQAECLRELEQADAVATAARASFLSAFTVGQGYSADADYSPRAWLMHKTRISKGAAVAHTAWARRATTHPRVVAALAARELSESYGRTICTWTDKLPEECRAAADEILVAAATAGMGVRDLAGLFAEIYERSRSQLPDEDPGQAFEDRGRFPILPLSAEQVAIEVQRNQRQHTLLPLFHELPFLPEGSRNFLVHPPAGQRVLGAAEQHFVPQANAVVHLLVDVVAGQELLFIQPTANATAL